MTAPLTGFSITNFPADILWDTGVIFVGATPLGTTSGAPKVTRNTSYTNIDFDGKHAPVKGLDRRMHGAPSLAFTMLEVGNATSGNQLATLEVGSTSATDAGTPPVTTVTPAKSGHLVASGDYKVDVRAMWERGAAGSGNYFAVLFPCGLFVKYDIAGQAKKEGQIAVEVEGRVDTATMAIDDPAFRYEYRTNLPTS